MIFSLHGFFQKYKCQQAVVSVRNIRDVFITENPVRRTERKSVRQKWGMRERERERDRRTDCVCVCVSNCVSVQLQHLVFHPVTPPPVLMSTFSLLGSFTGVCGKKTFWICKHHILSSFRSLSGAKLTPLVESLLRSGWSNKQSRVLIEPQCSLRVCDNCFNNMWSDIIEYVSHFAENKQKHILKGQKHSLHDEAY